MLREQTNLQIQLRPAVCRIAEAVLADEHEGREKDGLQRDNHRQEPIGEGVERWYPHMASVYEQPGTKPEDMEVHKDHTARKGGDSIGQALLHGPFVCCLETQPRDGTNVALNDMGEQGVGHLWLVGEVRGLVCHAQTLVWRFVL